MTLCVNLRFQEIREVRGEFFEVTDLAFPDDEDLPAEEAEFFTTKEKKKHEDY
jgi:hypothetical protein